MYLCTHLCMSLFYFLCFYLDLCTVCLSACLSICPSSPAALSLGSFPTYLMYFSFDLFVSRSLSLFLSFSLSLFLSFHSVYHLVLTRFTCLSLAFFFIHLLYFFLSFITSVFLPSSVLTSTIYLYPHIHLLQPVPSPFFLLAFMTTFLCALIFSF